MSTTKTTSTGRNLSQTLESTLGDAGRQRSDPLRPFPFPRDAETEWTGLLPKDVRDRGELVRHLATPRSDSRCPACRAVIYSRRHKLCGVCGETLPSELLFSSAQAIQIEQLLRLERQQHRAWMQKER